jgi:hypothetical protein
MYACEEKLRLLRRLDQVAKTHQVGRMPLERVQRKRLGENISAVESTRDELELQLVKTKLLFD